MYSKIVLCGVLLALVACESSDDADLASQVEVLSLQVAELQNGLATCMELTEANQASDVFETITFQQQAIETNSDTISTLQEDVKGLWRAMDEVRSDIDRVAQTTQQNALAAQSNKGTLDNLSAKVIYDDVVWHVGTTSMHDFRSLEAAMDTARKYSIHPQASIRIEVAPGVYNHTQTLSLNHPDGERLTIEGSVANPGTVVLSFSGVLDTSVLLNEGHTLQSFKGFTIRGDGVETYNGLGIQHRALAYMGSLIIEDFTYHGVLVGYQGLLHLDEDSVVIQNNGKYGLQAYYGGLVRGKGVISNSNGHSGVYAVWNGIVSIPNSTFESNGHSGGLSHYGGVLVAHGSESRYNTYYGFYAYGESLIYALSYTDSSTGVYHRTVSNHNGRDGFYAHTSMIRADGSQVKNNDGYGVRSSYHGFLDARDATGNGGNNGFAWRYTGSADLNATLRE